MSTLVEKGLEAITARTNLATGLAHPNDMNAAKEMFVLLHAEGEILLSGEIEAWAEGRGWKPDDARELGELGAQIGAGKKPHIGGGPWWREDLIDRFKAELAAS